MDATTIVPEPYNEPVRGYAPGSPERTGIERALAQVLAGPVEIPMTIGGEPRRGTGEPIEVRQPCAHATLLGTQWEASRDDVTAAVDAALAAARSWRELPFDERAAVFLRAADLLSGPWRDRLNASTMLGQSKTVYQAEIDATCELADFWRFNVAYAADLLAEQPRSAPGTWNRMDHRPLEGFVLAITPFNFTSIAGNLPTAPALMGNTVVWKPSPTQALSAHAIMELLASAGLPAGVINLVTGNGEAVSEVALAHPALAGVHFTGSTATFQHLWRTVGQNIDRYRSYPRLVGETGGKDFVIAHPSADPDVLRTALVRGAFEYQGQKCSAAARSYIPRSVWSKMGDDLVAEVAGLAMGPVTDFGNFVGAVIDGRSFSRLSAVLKTAADAPDLEVLAGGVADDSEGWFVRPTVIRGSDPTADLFTTEYFGPILGVHVFDDADYEAVLGQAADVSSYALTGSIIADDRRAVEHASQVLRFSAGNFYVNDKPTGAVVGQQPFGGGRASGTNDKAGSPLNLLRWVSPRAIKETFVPATDYRYPYMG